MAPGSYDEIRYGWVNADMMMKRTLKAAVALTTSVLAAASLGTAPAAAAGSNSFRLHLACDNGQSYEIFVNDGNTAAALADGSNVVAVLPGGRRGTAVPAYSDGGPLAGTLVSCETGVPGFTALVLLTPRRRCAQRTGPARDR